MDGTGDRCYENFGRNFTFCGFVRYPILMNLDLIAQL